MRLLPKQVDRLIAASVIGMVLIVWLVLVGFDSLNTFLNRLGDMGDDGFSLPDMILYLAWSMPGRLYEWFGNAALIGALLGLGGLATTAELTALRAAGLSKLRVSSSVIVTIVMLLLAVMLMGEFLAPYATARARAIDLRTHSSSVHLPTSSGLWARDGDNIINAKNVLASVDAIELVDVRIFTLEDDGDLERFTHAENARYQHDEWRLHDVRQSDISDTAINSTTQADMPWQTSLDTTVLKQSSARPSELSMRDLLRNMHYLADNNQSSITYSKAFWEQVFYPINVLVLVICALPFCFGALRSGGLGKRIFIGVILALGWHFLQQGVSNAGIVYGLAPWLADLLPALVLLFVAGLYFRRFA